jgi:hypothetical protein
MHADIPRSCGAKHRVWIAMILIAATTTAARAQECLGSLPFDQGRIRVGAAGERRASESRVAGTVGMGGSRLFGEVAGGIVTRDAFETSGRLIGGSAGAAWQLPFALRACPVASVRWILGPKGISGSEVDASTFDTRIGLSIGRAFRLARGVHLIPAAGGSLRREQLVLDSPASGESFRRVDVFGTIDATLGFAFASRVSIVPRVGTTVGALDDGMHIALAIAVGFWRGQ